MPPDCEELKQRRADLEAERDGIVAGAGTPMSYEDKMAVASLNRQIAAINEEIRKKCFEHPPPPPPPKPDCEKLKAHLADLEAERDGIVAGAGTPMSYEDKMALARLNRQIASTRKEIKKNCPKKTAPVKKTEPVKKK